MENFMLNRKISSGSLWLGKTWKEAIVEHSKTPDCWFEKQYKYKNPHLLLDDEKIFDCYYLVAYGNRFKEYRTKVPKTLNVFIENSEIPIKKEILK